MLALAFSFLSYSSVIFNKNYVESNVKIKIYKTYTNYERASLYLD